MWLPSKQFNLTSHKSSPFPPCGPITLDDRLAPIKDETIKWHLINKAGASLSARVAGVDRRQQVKT